MNIYVGNMSFETTEEDVKEAFEAHGQVESVAIVKDRYSGEPRGYGFVEMPDSEEGQSAIAALNGTELKGRALRVEEARPRSERRRGGGRRDDSRGGSRGGERRF